jgi:hypothetical protein
MIPGAYYIMTGIKKREQFRSDLSYIRFLAITTNDME